MLKRPISQRVLQVSALALMALTSACSVSNASPPDSAPDASSNTTVVTPTPTPTPAPAAVTPAPTPLIGETAVADNFDGTPGIEKTSYPQPNGGGIPAASIDAPGAFRMFCTAGQLLKDDPLVYPGQAGVSHLHQFFGNTGTDANSNYQSLRSSGGTTCGQSSTPFNRSAYWFPAMLDGRGNAVKPRYINVYYKRNPLGDPMCSPSSAEHLGQCVDLPNGIRYVFGYNMKDGSHSITDPNSAEHWSIHYECWASEDHPEITNGTATGRYWSISDVASAGCPIGARLMILANAPNCWDGVNLDSADHRSHMAWGTGTYYAGQMFNACPADHPYVIPDLQVQIAFMVDANLANWRVSSDEMVPGAPHGATFHMDYWEAWSPSIKATWHKTCINGHLSCASGDLGNGTDIIGAGVPNGYWPAQQVVPAP